MSHEALREKLLDLAYGELSPREARRVEEHAASCESCRAELERIRGTRRIMSALPEEPAPERGERILVAAARERAEAKRRRRLLPPWIWGAAAAAFSLVVVAAVSYRILAMRPGPLGGRGDEPLLGTGPYQAAPPPVAAEAPRADASGAAPRPEDPSLSPRAAEGEGRGDGRPTTAGDAARSPELSPPPGGERRGQAPRSKESADAAEMELAEKHSSRYAQPPPARAPDASDPARAPAGESEAGAPSASDASGFTPAPGRSAAQGAREADRGARAAPSAKASRAPEVSDAPAAAEPPARGEVAAAEAEPLRPAPSMDAPSRRAPEASRAEAAPPAVEAAPSGAAPAPRALRAAPPGAALERWQALRDAGALREEVRTFPRCAGEAVRRVELDPEGRLVRYVREGRIGGRRLRVEHVYGADGRLAVATIRDLDAPGTRLDADALGLTLPGDAGEARLDAPPRCGP